jgi:hypothetical protein
MAKQPYVSFCAIKCGKPGFTVLFIALDSSGQIRYIGFMLNWTREKQHSYSVFLTPEQAEALQEMVMAFTPEKNPTPAKAANRIEAKRKLRVLLDAIRRREAR